MNDYIITKDEKTRWPGKFDWLVTCNKLRMGWFGSHESAETWIQKQLELAS